jgi:Pyruvate flavodoxin/ferredoxin oxidoreductase, thiamine diP-bdg
MLIGLKKKDNSYTDNIDLSYSGSVLNYVFAVSYFTRNFIEGRVKYRLSYARKFPSSQRIWIGKGQQNNIVNWLTAEHAFAGVRAMIGTSAGGFALMVEGLSLAGMTETLIVIAEMQRPGPVTGLPKRAEQADLLSILHAVH